MTSWMKLPKSRQKKSMNWTRKLENFEKKGNNSVTIPNRSSRSSRICTQESSESMRSRTQPSMLTQKLGRLLQSHPVMIRTKLAMFSRLERSQPLLSLSWKGLLLSSLSSAGLSVVSLEQTRLLQSRLLLTRFQTRNLRIKKSKRMRRPSQNLSRLTKRVTVLSKLCCVHAHSKQMKS